MPSSPSPTSSAPSSASQGSDANRNPKVIYVMGAGRSGSTILGVALGNCENVFFAGELDAWLRRSGVPNFSGAARARFWNAIHEQVNGEDLYGEEAWRYLEHSLSPLHIRSWFARRRLSTRYREITNTLFRTIAASSLSTHVVDTSHYPRRARALRKLADIDLYIIYLTRDSHDVVASFQRRDITNRSKTLLATNAYLFLTHLLSTHTFLRHPSDKRLLLRHEDFVADPSNVLRHVLDWLHVSGPVPDFASLSTGIPFQGNRLLESKMISLRSRAISEHSELRRAWTTSLIQSPWKLFFRRLRPAIHTATRHRRDGPLRHPATPGHAKRTK